MRGCGPSGEEEEQPAAPPAGQNDIVYALGGASASQAPRDETLCACAMSLWQRVLGSGVHPATKFIKMYSRVDVFIVLGDMCHDVLSKRVVQVVTTRTDFL